MINPTLVKRQGYKIMPAKTTSGFDKYCHKIQSFAKREGRLAPRQKKALEECWEYYGLNLDDGMIDIEVIKQGRKQCVLEIGFGMGKSFFEMAEQAPDIHYVGIEVHRPGVGALFSKVQEAGLENVKVYCADAVKVMECCIPDNSIDKIQIFFPDPWPKQRHRKRRLIQIAFVKELKRKLKVGGVLHFATDWEDYAKHMMKVMLASSGYENMAGEDKYALRPGDRPLTKYEERGKRLGHGVWDVVFTKMD
jgi:tRNA (guanine-N7-)-methyltransferase